jgi:DNA-binding beta-propeller fold protein YncE
MPRAFVAAKMLGRASERASRAEPRRRLEERNSVRKRSGVPGTLGIVALFGTAACGGAGAASASGSTTTSGGAMTSSATSSTGSATSGSSGAGGSTSASLPLVLVADVDLPGKATRFDYQDIDAARGHLVIAHMNDASVLVVNLSDGSLAKLLPNIPVARGVIVGDDVGRIFVTSSPNKLVILDNTSLTEIARVDTGSAPDGVGWDPVHQVVGVSDQGDGALSLIAGAGSGKRTQVPLGVETGNVVFDAARGVFWVSVVAASPPDQLVAVDPVTATATTHINLPGCAGAHGLRLHPDGQSALVACENNDVLARVDLGGAHSVVTAKTGAGPDVLSIDPGLGWIYVAAESGNLTVFDIHQPGLVAIDHEHPAANAHTVAADPATHRVYFPLPAGPKGTPVLRIMKPSGMP